MLGREEGYLIFFTQQTTIYYYVLLEGIGRFDGQVATNRDAVYNVSKRQVTNESILNLCDGFILI